MSDKHFDPWSHEPWIIVDRLADVILTCVEGCIVEIGVGHSSFTLAKHAQAFDRIYHACDSSWKRCDWLEKQPEIVFDKLIVHRKKSTEFIETFDDTPAIVFIDGNHRIKTVIYEFEFFIKKLAVGGVMFFHDTCPMEGYYERKLEKRGREMNTWRLKPYLKLRDDIEVFTWPYTAATCGLTMVLKKDMSAPFYRV